MGVYISCFIGLLSDRVMFKIWRGPTVNNPLAYIASALVCFKWGWCTVHSRLSTYRFSKLSDTNIKKKYSIKVVCFFWTGRLASMCYIRFWLTSLSLPDSVKKQRLIFVMRVKVVSWIKHVMHRVICLKINIHVCLL